MHSAVLIVARPGRGPRIECSGGLAARQTEPDTVHLVSAAATPLGGDTIGVRVVVEPGARLRLRSVAATIALPGATDMQSHAHWDLEVAGALDLDPEPTVIAGGSSHVAVTRVRIDGHGSVRLRERVQIGRAGEHHGFWSGSMSADLDGLPLLRHRVEIGTGAVTDDPLVASRAYIGELRYPETTFDGQGTVMALAAGGCLSTWQGARL
ncbi:urease accessory protein [Mycobacterium sp. MAA66]|uniref:urease accessory protein UreD n=1 Tax=Mycobacterium sp. MAA66 TaxID=3156297 RepID=UPI0035136394